MKPAIFALASLLPLMAGTTPAAAKQGDSFVAQLCNGGTITIPLGDSDSDDRDSPCQMTGCHGAPCREKSGKKKFDPTQGRDGEPLR